MIQQISLDKYYRLMNIGPTVMVSAKSGDRINAMSAAWAGVVDFAPTAKVNVILDKSSYTRKLIEESGYFVLQIPVARQAELVMKLGGSSGHDDPQKIEHAGGKVFYKPELDVPLIEGCAGWILCKHISSPENETLHDLFLGSVIAAYADDEIFDGHWKFETADKGWRTLHYVAGGQFYTIGDSLNVEM